MAENIQRALQLALTKAQLQNFSNRMVAKVVDQQARRWLGRPPNRDPF
jgi:hypothetical protein